ncbi:MAG: hypothetical protein IKM61_05055 [Eubacteriaceae bacterium]|nr:hypothetical protein [Eubacteriaceae bacterium]
MKKMLKALAFCMVVFILAGSVGNVFAADKPVMELSFDGKNYTKGEIATAELIVYNTSYNVLGFSLDLGNNVKIVDENGKESANGDVLVRIEDVMYRGEGIYSILSCDVSGENIKTTVYVNPNATDSSVKENSVSVGTSDRKVATISFMMTEDGIPDVEFATIPGDTDFSDVSFFMLNNGTQPAGSEARVRYTAGSSDKDIKDEKDDKAEVTGPAPDAAEPEKGGTDTDTVIISGVIPEGDKTVTGESGTDISDLAEDSIITDTDAEPNDNSNNEGDELTVQQRIFGIAVLGLAFGITGGVVMKKIMEGHRKDMDHMRDNLRD